MIKKGQITLEACVLIALVVAGLLAMQVYLRRAIQANWRTNTDSFYDAQYNPTNDEDMDPGESNEAFPGIVFEGSTITALSQLNRDPQLDVLETFDVAGLSDQILQIDNWHEKD